MVQQQKRAKTPSKTETKSLKVSSAKPRSNSVSGKRKVEPKKKRSPSLSKGTKTGKVSSSTDVAGKEEPKLPQSAREKSASMKYNGEETHCIREQPFRRMMKYAVELNKKNQSYRFASGSIKAFHACVERRLQDYLLRSAATVKSENRTTIYGRDIDLQEALADASGAKRSFEALKQWNLIRATKLKKDKTKRKEPKAAGSSSASSSTAAPSATFPPTLANPVAHSEPIVASA